MSELPQGWVEVRLDEVGELICGQSPSAHQVNSNGQGVPYVTGPEQWDGVSLHKPKWTTHPKKMVPDGTLFITVKGAGVGKIFPGIACAIGRDVYAYKPLEAIHFDFVRYGLKRNVSEVIRRARGDIPGLSREDILSHGIQLPPLAEQRRIVAKVDGLAARSARARADLDRIPVLVERFKQAVLERAFSGELTGKSAPLVDFGSIVHEIRYGTAAKCTETPIGSPVLRIPNISSGRIDLTDMKYAELPSKELEKLKLRHGDILVIRSNGSTDLVGRPALVEKEAAGMAYAGYLIRLRPNLARLDPRFGAWMLQAPPVRRTIETTCRSTSGVNNINSGEIAAFQIPLPPLPEQHAIVARIEAAFARIDRIAAEAARARRLVDRLDAGVLDKAFRGALVPQDPADEPASALLERIRKERAAAPKARRGRRPRGEAA